MRKQLFLLMPLALSGCAMPTTVQRMGIEYNGAVAGMTNELALVNILRAKEGLPLHYTAISRASGAVTLKATSGFNASVKADGVTDGTSTMATAQNTTNVGGTGPASSAVSTLANGLTSMIAHGGNVYTPSIGGEIDTGPSFDITILNDQKFYQGILSAVPYATIDDLIAQGFDEELVLRLMVNRITFKLHDVDTRLPSFKKGDVLLTITSPPFGDQARWAASYAACYDLVRSNRDPKIIGTLDRFTHDGSGAVKALELKDLALLDGKQFDLSQQMGSPSADSSVQVQRPVDGVAPLLQAKPDAATRMPAVYVPPQSEGRDAGPAECYKPITIVDQSALPAGPIHLKYVRAGVVPQDAPPSDPIYTADSMLTVPGPHGTMQVKADMEITFRSTEGAFRFVGQYLEAAADPATQSLTYLVRDHPLFSIVKGDSPNALASTTILGQRYSIANDAQGRRNMQIIAILEQLMNLQKSSDTAPQTVPVRVIPGG